MTLENLIGKGLQREPSRGGHHVLALQTLTTTIGYPREKIRLLDEYRRQRGLGLYDGSFDPSTTEVAALINEAINLQQHFQQWLAATHPELL